MRFIDVLVYGFENNKISLYGRVKDSFPLDVLMFKSRGMEAAQDRCIGSLEDIPLFSSRLFFLLMMVATGSFIVP